MYAIVEIDNAFSGGNWFENPDDYNFASERMRKTTPKDEPIPHVDVTTSGMNLLYADHKDTLLGRYWKQIQQDRTEALEPVDIVVYNSKGSVRRIFSIIEEDLGEVMGELGWESKVHLAYERFLEKGMIDEETPVPQNAVVHIHGNVGYQFENVGDTRRLAEERPDLKFIIYVDPKCAQREQFADPADYHFVRGNLTERLNPAQQIVISRHFPSQFFTGEDDILSYPIKGNDFKAYMTQLKALRGQE